MKREIHLVILLEFEEDDGVDVVGKVFRVLVGFVETKDSSSC